MASFQRGTTVICSIEIYDVDGNLTDPNESVNITIWEADIWEKMVNNATMLPKDDVGRYHYDYQTELSQPDGRYRVDYWAVNDSRTSLGEDWFELT